MFLPNLFNRSYCSYWAGCLLLLCVSHLSGEGYVFLKEEGIPEQLIPQDCPADRVPEATKLTPTQAHLYAWQKNSIRACLNTLKKETRPYLDIIKQLLENEKAYAQTHYVFYHAQNGAFRFFQDFLKEFYAFLNIQAPFSHFEFLRAYHEAIPRADVNQFLDDQKKTIANHWHFDHLPKIRRKLLSVNLSLFGNIKSFGECTFRYFRDGTSCSSFDMDWIIKTIHRLLKMSLSENEERELHDLFKKIGKSGSLFQICIPRTLVDNCVYLCEPLGIPRFTQLIACCYDSSKKRHIRISDILDAYVTPGFCNFHWLDELQARILLSQDIVLNPNSGVKIFRFTQVHDNDSYQEKLVQFIHRIAIRYLAYTMHLEENRNSLAPFNRLASMLLK